jgi:hypothetical protein
MVLGSSYVSLFGRRAGRGAALLAAATAALALALPAWAQSLPVRPILECVVENGPGNYTAHFGHLNENPDPVTIPVGSDNRFTPLPQDRGQTTDFPPGRSPFFPNAAFQVDFNGSNLVWTLRSPDGSTRTSTASSGSTRCPEIPSEPFRQYSICYSAYQQLGAPKPPKLVLQLLQDYFASRRFDFTVTRAVCPALETTYGGDLFPILDAETHLKARTTALSRTEPPQAKFDPRAAANRNLFVDDAFGSHQIDLTREERVLLPAALCHPGSETCPPSPSDLPLDGLATEKHKCFAVTRSRGTPRFPNNVNLIGVDRFQSRVYRVVGPKILCLRTSHNGHDPGAVTDPDALLCHGLRVPRLYCEPGAPPPFSLAACRRDSDCGGAQCIQLPKPVLTPKIPGVQVHSESAPQLVNLLYPQLVCGPATLVTP